MDTDKIPNTDDNKQGSELLKNLKQLSLTQVFSIVSMLLIGLTIPVTIFMAMSPIKPIITPASGPVTPPNSPTPPVIGNTPVIITSELNTVKLSKPYRQVIEGYDLDTGDELTFQAEGLPDGLKLTDCHSNVKKVNGISENKINYMSCVVSGNTSKFGVFDVKLTLLDGFNFTQKTLQLSVK